MEALEATNIVMSRIKKLDPENAMRIIGYILIQEEGAKEMLKLSTCSEGVLVSFVNQAKACLGLITNTSPRPNLPFPQTSPRIVVPENGFNFNNNPFSPGFSKTSPRPMSYASIVSNSNADLSSNNSQFYNGNDMFLDDSYRDDVASPFHRRSCSVNDAAFLASLEDGVGGVGGGYRPCMYFARGFCKNGGNCKFSHGDFVGGEAIEIGSPSSNGIDEFMRLKAIQQQRFALMAAGRNHLFGHSKGMNFVNENHRNELLPMGLSAGSSSSSLQIYLTFPADSTFKEEHVSSYFSMFGPVQDVRIPYQQKRMFGFVTFVYPETVKLILAKGNPHFVCDSRVLVKPYKEKGKIPDKKLFQHMERGDYSACLSPTELDSREQFDVPFGPRMLLNTQETMLRRKFEQEAEIQHAVELQERRMMNLQLMDMKNQLQIRPFVPRLPSGVSISSPRNSQVLLNQGNEFSSIFNIDNGNNQEHIEDDDSDLFESLEHILPDNLFASPTKSVAEKRALFSPTSAEADDSVTITNTSPNITAPVLPTSSPLSMASINSCYFQTQSH